MKLVTLILIVACLSTANAQSNIEYGQPEELSGVTKIYVGTGTDLSGRNNIINLITKELPNVVIVSSVEEAEVALIYSSDSYRELASIVNSRNSTTTGNLRVSGNRAWYSEQTNSTSSTAPVYKKITDGSGLVVKFTENGRSRLLMNFKDSKSTILERRPSTNFARKFVSVYKEANRTSILMPQKNVVPLVQLPQSKAPAMDLTGRWSYADNLVQLTQSGSVVNIAYSSPNNCNSSSVADLLNGRIEGSSLNGNMTICTNEKLVTSCGLPPISEVPFTASVEQDRIIVTATIPGMGIAYGSDGRCNVTSDKRQNSFYKFTLLRSSK